MWEVEITPVFGFRSNGAIASVKSFEGALGLDRPFRGNPGRLFFAESQGSIRVLATSGGTACAAKLNRAAPRSGGRATIAVPSAGQNCFNLE